jgi:predicted secreted hydrolase
MDRRLVVKQELSAYRARIAAKNFQFDFTLEASVPPVLHGQNGLSRKVHARVCELLLQPATTQGAGR